MKIFLKRIFFLLAIVLGATQIIVAQGEANIWYFGFNAGLDFNTSPPTPLTNGQLATWEGCASIADKNGALVFYTDGTTVWDKTHTPMPNGNGLFGNSSSTQSAIIVPYPGTYNYTNRHFDKYFIVTVDHQAGSHGVNYSEVDMTLNNGLGDVTATKNVHLYDASVTSEKICVAPHSNNCDFWVIGKPYANVDYYAYPITSSGFNTTPVISSVGPAMDNLFGSLKTSPDSKLVVATHSGSPNGIYVYDFNNTTGVLTSKFSDVSPGGYSYSQEFSPDNKILYWTLLNNPNVYQFDLTVANNPAFLASRQIIGTTANGNGFRMCALQIAPDGKIYAALQQQTSVSVINNPNVLGVGCGYVDMQQSLAGKVCGLGLPALVTSLIRPVNKIIISDSCVKQTVQFNLLDTNKITGYNWSYAKLSTPNNVIGTSAIYNPTMQFDTAGDYLITAVNHYACFLDTIIDTISILPLPIISLTAKNVTCFGLNNGSIVATSSGTVAPYTYTWSNSATTDTIKHLAPAAYSVSVTDAKGCISHDSAVITSPVALQVDTIIVTDVKCFGDSTGDAIISVSGGTAPYSYSWNTTPTQTTQHALALPAGTYTCTVTDSNSCVANRSAIIIEPPLLTVNITNHLSVCRGSSGNLNAIGGGGFGTLTYSWIPGNITTPVINVGPDSTTKYILTVTDSNNCIAKDSSLVIINPNPVVSFGATLVCVGDSSVFTDSTTITSGSIATYNWTFGLGSAGSTLQNPTYSYINCNTYTIGLTAISDSGCTSFNSKPVEVYCRPVAAFNVNNVCTYTQAIFNNTSSGAVTYNWDFNYNTGVDDTASFPSHTYVPGTDTIQLIAISAFGCKDTVTHSIDVYPKPLADFEADTICFNHSTFFNDQSTVAAPDNIIGWQWDFDYNTGIDSITQNPSNLYAQAGTFSSFLKVTTNHGCVDSVTKTIVVHPLPHVIFNAQNVCDGMPVLFNDNSSIPSTDAIAFWIWNFGDTSVVNNNQNPSHLYSAAGSYNVKQKAVSTFGCVDSLTQQVVVNPNPVVSFNTADTIGCEPLCVTFQNTSFVPNASIASWLWNFGDNTPVSTSQDALHCYSNDSVFSPVSYSPSLTITSDSACVITLSKSNYITVYPLPNAAFAALPQTATITNPEISVSDLSTGAQTWFWSWGDSDTTSNQNPSPHIYADTGVYQILLITSNQYNCIDTTSETVIIEPDFMFYIPNAFTPNDDGVNDIFTGNGMFVKEFEMSIFDRWGNLIYKTDSIDKPWDGKANKGNEPAQQEVYVYTIKTVDFKLVKHTYRGTVTLVR